MASRTDRYVYFGAVPYDDPDGIHRLAYRGDLVSLNADDLKRLDGLGALYPPKWDPDAQADADAEAAAAPTGVESELMRARQEVAKRDAAIAELQASLADQTARTDAALNAEPLPPGPPGSPGGPTEDEQRAARNEARRAAARARKADKPSTKASAAKAAKEDQPATGTPIAADPFDSTNQTPPVAVDKDNQPLAEQPAAPPVE